MPLQPCRHCRRHVATTARACPFCGGAVVAGAPRTTPTGRSTRKAIAVLSFALAGCSGSDETTTGSDTGTADAAFADTGVADTAVADTGTDVGSDTGATDTGAAETSTDAADAGDAKSDATDAVADADTGPIDTGFFPPYGHPPWDEAFV